MAKAIDLYRKRVERGWAEAERIMREAYPLSDGQLELLRRCYILGSVEGALATLNVVGQTVAMIEEKKQPPHIIRACIDGYCEDLKAELKALGQAAALGGQAATTDGEGSETDARGDAVA